MWAGKTDSFESFKHTGSWVEGRCSMFVLFVLSLAGGCGG